MTTRNLIGIKNNWNHKFLKTIYGDDCETIDSLIFTYTTEMEQDPTLLAKLGFSAEEFEELVTKEKGIVDDVASEETCVI